MIEQRIPEAVHGGNLNIAPMCDVAISTRGVEAAHPLGATVAFRLEG
jgi:hypothetical protein